MAIPSQQKRSLLQTQGATGLRAMEKQLLLYQVSSKTAMAFENKLKVRLSIQATTALAETTAIADFRSLTVFSAIAVV